MHTQKKLVILDRDGVINFDSDEYIKSPTEWRAIPGSLEAIARLNQNGYQVAIATNQQAVARGLIDVRMLNTIHQKLHLSALAVGAHINAIFFCPHAVDEFCDCRKPRPGMLTAIGKRFGVSLTCADGGRRATRYASGFRGRLRTVSGSHRERRKDACNRWPAARDPSIQ